MITITIMTIIEAQLLSFVFLSFFSILALFLFFLRHIELSFSSRLFSFSFLNPRSFGRILPTIAGVEVQHNTFHFFFFCMISTSFRCISRNFNSKNLFSVAFCANLSIFCIVLRQAHKLLVRWSESSFTSWKKLLPHLCDCLGSRSIVSGLDCSENVQSPCSWWLAVQPAERQGCTGAQSVLQTSTQGRRKGCDSPAMAGSVLGIKEKKRF